MLSTSSVFYGYDDPAATGVPENNGFGSVSAVFAASKAAGVPDGITNPKQISKVKLLDVHPARSWLLAADVVSRYVCSTYCLFSKLVRFAQAGVVVLWDYSSGKQLCRFEPSVWKDTQLSVALATKKLMILKPQH